MTKKMMIVLLILFLVTGCEGVNDESAAATATPTNSPVQEVIEPRSGGELKISMRIPKTLNPLLNEDMTVDTALKLLFEPLVALDETQKPVPNLAESLNFSEDGRSVVIKLKEGLLWSDGERLTARDVAFSINTIKGAGEETIYKEAARNILTPAVIDETTIQINYAQPFGGSAYLLCFPIIPEHYYKGETKLESEKNMNPVGSGLYRFQSYETVKQLNLVPNEYSSRQKPYIENITAIITSDSETDLYSFEQNIISVVTAPVADWGKYRGSKETNNTEYLTSYFDFIGFNFNHPYLKEKRIREAIACIVPIDKIVSEIYLGHAEKAITPISPNSWLYDGNVTEYKLDLEKAKGTLQEFGFVDKDSDGIFENGFIVNILVNEENEERVKIAKLLKESLLSVGIHSEIDVQPFVDYEQKLTDKNYDVFVGGFNLSVIPDLTFAFHSSQISLGKNYFGYNNSDMDAALAVAFNAVDEASYKNALSDLQKYFADELPCLGLVFRKSVLMTDKNIYGDKKPVINNIFSNINEWFVYDTIKEE